MIRSIPRLRRALAAVTALASWSCGSPPPAPAPSAPPAAAAPTERPAARALEAAGRDSRCPDGEPGFLRAAGQCQTDQVQACLDTGIDIDALDGAGRGALDRGVAAGCLDVARLLLERGIALFQDDERNPLATAVARGDRMLVELLLDGHADPDATLRGTPPLVDAVDRVGAPMVTLLLRYGAGVGVRDGRGRTPLGAAAERGDLRSATELVGRGADPNEESGGSTPLEIARLRRDRDLLDLFAGAAGAEPPAEDATAPEAATEQEVEAVVDALRALAEESPPPAPEQRP